MRIETMAKLSFLPAVLLAVAAPLGCGDDTTSPTTSSTGVGGAGGTGGAGGAGGAGGGSTNPSSAVSANPGSLSESDPDLARSADGEMVITWVGTSGADRTHVGYSFSTDGGDTWTEPTLFEPDGDVNFGSPSVTAGRDGEFYLAFTAFPRSGAGGAVLVASALPGESMFTEPVSVTNPELPGLYADARITVTKKGAPIVAFSQFLNQNTRTVVGRSVDGVTWTTTVLEPEENNERFPYPCAPPATGGATVARSWLVYAVNGRTVIRWSDDDGVTWSPDARREVRSLLDAGPHVGAPTCVGDGNEVWVAYGVGFEQSQGFGRQLQGIVIGHSTQGAEDFADNVQYGLLHDGSLEGVFASPRIALEESGAVDVVYYEGLGPGDELGSLRTARWETPPPTTTTASTTTGAGGGGGMGGGEPAGLPSQVVAEPVALSLLADAPGYVGDLPGLRWADGKILVAYVNNADGPGHISFTTTDAP